MLLVILPKRLNYIYMDGLRVKLGILGLEFISICHETFAKIVLRKMHYENIYCTVFFLTFFTSPYMYTVTNSLRHWTRDKTQRQS